MPLTKIEIKARCTRFLSGPRQKSAKEWLSHLAASPLAEQPLDDYGKGEAIASLEREVAALLGKEAGVFVMKGVIAQQMALRVWTDRSGVPTVALHPKSHIDFDENAAYERLHNLKPVRLGNHAPFRVNDLEKVGERLGVVTVELPLRQAGFKLPTWDELVAISGWCRAHNVPLHFDGARLWECAPYYGRSYAEIAALADSVYVSFYKGLGALAGCVLAGPADFMTEAKVWKTRHGANLYTAFPYVIAAQEGLRKYLPEMEGYYTRACTLAKLLAALPGVSVAPNPPHSNAFQVYLPGEVAHLAQASLALAATERAWVMGWFSESQVPNLALTEISIGDAAEDFSDAEIVAFTQFIIERAKSYCEQPPVGEEVAGSTTDCF